MVQKSGIQCYNCKEYGHVARECQKLKRAKDAAYHREKMLLCKQDEAGIQLNADQADWKDDTDDEYDDQEMEAHYMYMAKIQENPTEQSRLGVFLRKEIFKGGMIRIHDAFVHDEEEMVADLRYFNSLESEVDSLRS
nr:hypothetical protein [Tanacetum cinerariifolium]